MLHKTNEICSILTIEHFVICCFVVHFFFTLKFSFIFNLYCHLGHCKVYHQKCLNFFLDWGQFCKTIWCKKTQKYKLPPTPLFSLKYVLLTHLNKSRHHIGSSPLICNKIDLIGSSR